MTTDAESLGSLEHIVLLAVMRIGPDSYGMTVRREISAAIEREISIGAVYTTLARLESKGYVKSYAGQRTAERGGRAKRHFLVTAAGIGAVRKMRKILNRMGDGIEALRGLP